MAIWGLSWELFARHRRVFTALVLYYVIVCAVCPLLPAVWRMPQLAGLLMLLPSMGLICVIGTVSYGYTTRLEDRASGYPLRLFTLPVSSWVLAFVPLVAGTLWSFVWWTLPAVTVLRPCGVHVPLIWPSLLMAALIAWTQALVWSPFPLRWMRLVVAAMVIPCVAFGVTVLNRDGDEWPVALVFTVLLVPAYTWAVAGVAWARRGLGRSEPSAPLAMGKMERITPFVSTFYAQAWLERRLRMWPGLLLLGIGLSAALASAYFASRVLAQEQLIAALPPPIPWQVATLGRGWMCATALLIIPAMFSLLGPDLGELSPRKNGSLAYLLALPIAPMTRLRHKCELLALVAVMAWVVPIVVGLIWATVTGHIGDMSERLVGYFGSPLATLAMSALILLLAMVTTWLWLAAGMWAGIPGRIEIAWIPVAASFGTLTLASFAMAGWRNISYQPWIIAGFAVLLALKVLAVVWVSRRLLARGLMRPLTLAGVIGTWLVVAGGIITLLVQLPEVGSLAAGLAVLLPLARPLLAPLVMTQMRGR